MKRFLAKICIYVLSVSAITLAVNALFIRSRHIPLTMGNVRNDTAVVKNVPYGIQICNFGSSHGYYGFNYEDIPQEYVCFSFALPSQSLRYDCKILQHYRNHIQNGAAVFIIASYFSFFGIPETQEDNFASKNKRYYEFLPADMIDQYDWYTALCVKYLPVLAGNSPFTMLKTLLFPAKNKLNEWSRETAPDETDGFARYEYHVTRRLDKHGRRIYKREAIEALYRMIDICREIGARPVLITTPYLHEYFDAAHNNDPQFFSDFHRIIDEVRARTGIEYYDYSEDERFSRRYDLFMNSDHLNRKGARIFTNTLLREVLGIDVE